MNEQTDNIKSLKEKGIFTQLWTPPKKARGGIVLIHGLGEYCERYKNTLGSYYTEKGFVIQTFDLPGHGRSVGKRGHVSNYQDFIDIISATISHIKNIYPDIPIFLYGHSLGGLIALDYVHTNPKNLKGFICSAPVLDVFQPINPFKKFLVKALRQLLPSFTMESDLAVEKLSKDQSVVDQYIKDPLVHPMTSSNLAMYIIERGDQIRKMAEKPSIPGLIMVGTEEGIVSKKAIVDFCDESHFCELKIWENLYHELHNEPEKEQVLAFVDSWMYKIIKGD